MKDKHAVAKALQEEAQAQRSKAERVYQGNPSLGEFHIQLAMALNDIADRLWDASVGPFYFS